MSYPHLFQPGAIGSLELKNRLICLSMSKNYANRDGSVTQRYVDYAVERARGGVGLIFLEAVYLRPQVKGRHLQLGIYDDRLISGLRRLTAAVRAEGARMGLQLNARGRQMSAAISGFQPVAPSAVPCPATGGAIPRPLTLEEIEAWVDAFGQGARRAREAGFDLVELHGATGYLIGQFLSPYSNKRTDAYGGSLENRLRFPLQVIARVRRVLGDDFPLSFRFCADEFIDGGLTLDDTRLIAPRLVAAGLDALNVTGGIYGARLTSTLPMGAEPGKLAYLAAEIKRLVQAPVVAAGKISTPDLAEEILRQGKADFIGLARVLHADPAYARKARQGRAEIIRPCITCNHCLEDLSLGMPIRCQVNAAAGRERELAPRPCRQVRRLVVIGGGPAGLEAARLAAERGCRVTLFEKERELGGHLRLWRRLPRHGEYADLLRYYCASLAALGIEARLGSEATVESVHDLAPDAVIVATGSAPYVPPFPGIERMRVTSAMHLVANDENAGPHVVVFGGSALGCLVAECLVQRGGRVTLCEPGPELAGDLAAAKRQALLAQLRQYPSLEPRPATTIEAVRPNSLLVQQGGVFSEIAEVSALVVAWTAAPERALLDRLKVEAAAPVAAVGDCVWPRGTLEAIHEGAAAAYALP